MDLSPLNVSRTLYEYPLKRPVTTPRTRGILPAIMGRNPAQTGDNARTPRKL